MKQFVGIDLHKDVSQIAVLRESRTPSQLRLANDVAAVERVLKKLPKGRSIFSRASHLDLFEQPAGGFFQHPTRDCRSSVGLELGKIQACASASRPTSAPTGPQPMATELAAHAPVAASQNDRSISRDLPAPGLA